MPEAWDRQQLNVSVYDVLHNVESLYICSDVVSLIATAVRPVHISSDGCIVDLYFVSIEQIDSVKSSLHDEGELQIAPVALAEVGCRHTACLCRIVCGDVSVTDVRCISPCSRICDAGRVGDDLNVLKGEHVAAESVGVDDSVRCRVDSTCIVTHHNIDVCGGEIRVVL